MDRIDLFRIFTRVVETSSFTRAADTLGMPRSSVSTAIQELETRLGVRLLARTTRQVAPTTDGSTFYTHCLQILQDIDDLETLFKKEGMGLQGVVRVNTPGRIGRLIVAPALPEFLSRYPTLKIELGVTDRSVNLIEDRLDCVVRVGPLEDANLIARKIGDLPLINVASPAYLARYGTPITPADLSQHQMVRYASPSTGRVEEWEWQEGATLHSLAMAGCVTVNSAETSIACCLAGLGLIQVPRYDVQSYLQTGQLVEVLPQWQPEPLPMSLLYPHHKHLSRRLTVFMEWLVTLLKPCVS
ncbi:LysR family transcriptional regulator [Acetobacter orientalis]|uniref:LysR family transcriptional regulator n=1 Tax=Acetobacter orientalis TaxID=146474 RepID=UPI00241C02AC|nr:LysR family transcriptional regulator [Acetobacter orientalis]